MATALITGASQGLGRALAEGLLDAGWSVVIDARHAEALERAAHDLAGHVTPGHALVARPGDVTDPGHRQELVAAVAERGGLDLLVNNASTLGATPLPPLTDYPIGELVRVLEVNTVAPLALIQAVWPWLGQSPRPRIVNVTSDASVESYPGWGGYGLAKAALDHLSAVLAVEQPAVRVWAVDPGDLQTQMHQDAFPGEDISDRPEPACAVPGLLALLGSDRPSGRVRLAELEGGAK